MAMLVIVGMPDHKQLPGGAAEKYCKTIQSILNLFLRGQAGPGRCIGPGLRHPEARRHKVEITLM
ncbi:hypothetical protein HRK08_16360 [Bordetella pertussis]|nr:hypothetical protein HRK16_16370 [Bordetella pertussis]ULY19824.1 hypothetical protein HRK08_16360 [Bordetella pertussis]ULY26693.1 hypothetical protein HRK06_16375 [Bordetella pertussis]ULY30019.1 hypothetical protein HRK05_16360 [Bordetella pertussis]ULY71440.1 hypothetical protein HRJ92_16340 [Bordetella pertussis]